MLDVADADGAHHLEPKGPLSPESRLIRRAGLCGAPFEVWRYGSLYPAYGSVHYPGTCPTMRPGTYPSDMGPRAPT